VTERKSTVMGEQKTPRDDFAPRVGFAWQPLATNKWVVRGGAGFFYDYIGGENYLHGVLQSVPFAENIGGSASGISFATLQNPWGNTPANWINRWVTASGNSSNINQPLLTASMPVPVTYEWNLNTQYQVTSNWIVEFGYVGSRGIHQITGAFPDNPALLTNAAITGAAPSSANINLRTPLLGFSPQLAAFSNNADYKYNGLQATLKKQFSNGLSLQAAYSYNRAFASQWSGNGAITGQTSNPTWALNPIVSEYGLNPNYHPNRFTLNYSYDLPSGKHDGALGVLARGWRVSGETTIQDGTPLSIVDSGLGTIFGSPVTGPAEYAGGVNRGIVPAPGSIQSRALNGWINLSAFCASNATSGCATSSVGIGGAAGGLGYGNAGLGTLLGPGQNNWDISVSKITKVGGLREDATLEFRTELFDAFNHPQFSNPNLGGSTIDISSPNSNQITSLSVNPRLIQFALKYSF
jgi:hypothetical protein